MTSNIVLHQRNDAFSHFMEEDALFESIISSNCDSNGVPQNAKQMEQYIYNVPHDGDNHKLNCSSTIIDGEDSGFITSSSMMASPAASPISTPMTIPFQTSLNVSVNTNSNVTFYDYNANPSWNFPKRNDEIKIFGDYNSRSMITNNLELRVTKQPEEHHRARYMTEGSRGAIKDTTGRGYPVIQLFGYDMSSIKLQCYIGDDEKNGVPHLFYQACEVSGKTPYQLLKVDGVNIIEVELNPNNNMQVVIDCMGILKERNVDVERKMQRSRKRNRRIPAASESHDNRSLRNNLKSRSNHCRMVFRCIIPETGEILQTLSVPIMCTQPLGTPEIYKMSLKKSEMHGGQELFIIGKNFHKDVRIVFEISNHWKCIVEPQKEYLNSTHIVCQIPPYDALDAHSVPMVNVDIRAHSNGKSSDPMKFTFINSHALESRNNYQRIDIPPETITVNQHETDPLHQSSMGVNFNFQLSHVHRNQLQYNSMNNIQ